jgi:hypothetical protein
MKRIRFSRGANSETVKVPLLAPLFDDFVECDEQLERSDTQFARRSYVRTVFALNEGFLYWFKQEVAEWLLDKGLDRDNVMMAKLFLLSDESYRITDKGKIRSQKNRVPFLDFCGFVYRTAAECLGVNPDPFFLEGGWQELKKALDVRHRITHPKKPEDLEITERELLAVSEGHRWLCNCVVHILNAIPGSTDDQVAVNA